MFRKLYDWTLRWAGSRHAPVAMGTVSFVESSVFPIPADVLFIPMVLANARLNAAMQNLTITQGQLSAQMQRARQESDMKLRFVTAVSHELRTPLNGITGLVDVLARSGLSEQQTELMADVETSTRQLRQWRRWALRAQARLAILRVPGIYAADRLPVERLKSGTPALNAADDVYTNHIHADDLARACVAALWRGKAQRVYNVNDDTTLKMGDYFDLAADLMGLPKPPRVSRSSATEALPLMLLSFMSESRRLDNTRMKRELRLRLTYPTVREGLSPQAQLL